MIRLGVKKLAFQSQYGWRWLMSISILARLSAVMKLALLKSPWAPKLLLIFQPALG